MITTLYRISDGGYKKDKLDFADKFYCLENYISVFGKDELIVFADNCKEETVARLKSYGLDVRFSSIGSSGQSWKMVAKFALENYKDDQIIYFLEDDYLHLKNSRKAIEEALLIADYVTLYDHPDKYIDGKDGGNPLVSNGGEFTKVYLTESSHWKQTNSTTMTFATKIATLKQDWAIWDEYTQDALPHDDQIFFKLQGLKKLKFKLFGKRKMLISPIPSLSTHTEKKWLGPLIDWNSL
ncbi:MAG: hypothetical protein ACKVOU_07125 [Cytophagales bacterium]